MTQYFTYLELGFSALRGKDENIILAVSLSLALSLYFRSVDPPLSKARLLVYTVASIFYLFPSSVWLAADFSIQS